MKPTPHSASPGLAALAGVLLVASCGDAAPAAANAEPVVRDSAGIAIVENVAPDNPALPVLVLASAPVLEIGMLDGPAAYQLDGVAGAVRRSDGSLVLGDRGSRELRWFDAEGRHLRSAGREGEGPGELRTLTSLHAGADDVVHAWDGRLARLTTFDPHGQPIRMVTIADPSPFATRLAAVHPEGLPILRDEPQTSELREADPGERRDTAAFVLHDAEGEPVHTLVRLPGQERLLYRDGTSWGTTGHFFGRDAHFAASGHGFAAATSDGFEIRVLDEEGAVGRLIRADVEPRAPSRAEVDAIREARLRSAAEQRMTGAPPEMVERLRASAIAGVERTSVAERQALFEELALSSGGALQIRLPAPAGVEDPDVEWLLFDRDGRLEGRLVLPHGTRLLDVEGGTALVVERDELDVEYVRMYELIKPEGAG